MERLELKYKDSKEDVMNNAQILDESNHGGLSPIFENGGSRYIHAAAFPWRNPEQSHIPNTGVYL